MTRREDVNELLELLEFSKDFPLIPQELVHIVCSAETSYNTSEYYRHEPGYWRRYMSVDKDFWGALYKLQFGEDGTEEQLSKEYAASYGIMQTMYDIVVASELNEYFNLKLTDAIADFRKTGKLREDWYKDLPKPKEINDDENGLWYGCTELWEKINTTYRVCIVKYYDKGMTPIKLEDGLREKETFRICGKPVKLMDFYKMCISGYQMGPGNVAKLVGFAKMEYKPCTWENLEGYLSRLGDSDLTKQRSNHIKRAFDGITEDQLKLVAGV